MVWSKRKLYKLEIKEWGKEIFYKRNELQIMWIIISLDFFLGKCFELEHVGSHSLSMMYFDEGIVPSRINITSSEHIMWNNNFFQFY